MSTEKLAPLLEQIVDQNTEMISLLSDILSEIREVNSELNWVGENSFAKRVTETLDSIESKLDR